jgi:uncharacterized protein YyaL (SSP411 family)
MISHPSHSHGRKPNRLANCTSPYLQQHALNPVDWYPWGNEALEKARTGNKLIFLSIGYASCHWCHVMERESFEDPEVAAYLNEHYVSIKVDREERPDLDAVYMEAVQLMTGSGGWPLNVWLNGALEPVFGGTYFPPESNYRLPSFRMVLERLVAIKTEDPEKINRQGASLRQALQEDLIQALREKPRAGIPVKQSAAGLVHQMDKKLGGFGSAPKFPNTMALHFLLKAAEVFNEPNWRTLVRFSTHQMLLGGIYDQLGGGLARYSTDNRWLVPHFEKMLYDQALLLNVMSGLLRAGEDGVISRRLTQTLAFLEREMQTENGCYASAIDADSEGVEGRFYTFSLEEIRKTLNDDTLTELATRYFGLTEHGNWEETHVLEVTDRGLETDEAAAAALEEIRAALFAVRNGRVRPITDTKNLLGWNALLLDAFCNVAAQGGKTVDYERALRLAKAIEKAFQHGGVWYRVYHKEQRQVPVFLDDTALACTAFLNVFELTGELHWFETAFQFGLSINASFYDGNGGFYLTGKGNDELPFKTRDVYDNAFPGATGAALQALQRLWRHTTDPVFSEPLKAASGILRGMASEYALSFGNLMQVILEQESDAAERVYIGEKAREAAAAYRRIAPAGTLVLFSKTETAAHPLLAGKSRPGGAGTWFWECANGTCSLPLSVD